MADPRKLSGVRAGGAYHVYRGAARGEQPVAHKRLTTSLAGIVGKVKAECGLTILAWCLMANHYHLLLLEGEPPL